MRGHVVCRTDDIPKTTRTSGTSGHVAEATWFILSRLHNPSGQQGQRLELVFHVLLTCARTVARHCEVSLTDRQHGLSYTCRWGHRAVGAFPGSILTTPPGRPARGPTGRSGCEDPVRTGALPPDRVGTAGRSVWASRTPPGRRPRSGYGAPRTPASPQPTAMVGHRWSTAMTGVSREEL